MKKLTIGLFVLAVLAAPVHGQGRGAAEPPSPEEMQKKRDQADLDKQYKNALKRSNSDVTPAKVDPWANMRGSNDQQPKR